MGNGNGEYDPGKEGVSVIMATYAGDTPDHVAAAIDSILDQTQPPDEVVIVATGSIPSALGDVLEDYRTDGENGDGDSVAPPIHVHSRSTDRGPGDARAIGVEQARYEYVAVMDSDDLAVSDRLEQQVEFLNTHPEIAGVGGYIAEFETDPTDPELIREVPCDPEAVADCARTRAPINHPTFVVRRSNVLAAGNYPEMYHGEDYVLYGRLLDQGDQLANIPAVLTNVRAGTEMHARRGGWQLALEETTMLARLHRLGAMSLSWLCVNLAVRLPMRLLPNQLRSAVYDRFLRS